MTLVDELRTIDFEKNIPSLTFIDQREREELHEECLAYVKEMIKDSLINMAHRGLIQKGQNKGFLSIGNSCTPYSISFILYAEQDLKKLTRKGKAFSFYHGPRRTSIEWFMSPADYDRNNYVKSACSPAEIVAILEEFGFYNVSYEIVKHAFNFKHLDNKYVGVEEAFYYSFTY